jgi:hypothetical protein
MNIKSEEKLLRELIKIIDNPDKAEKKFIMYTKIAMFVSMLFIFYCLSNNIDSIDNKYYFAIFSFISGMAFGLSIWFLQVGTQTGIMVKHMSKDSINRRIDEINI